MKLKNFKARILDFNLNEVVPVEVKIENGFFSEIKRISEDELLDFNGIILPGFIDSHIHIESSLLTPSLFCEAVLPFGTTSVVCDPHEIASVLGMDGINFMVENGKNAPFDFYFTAPSSVPATNFDKSGATIDSNDIDELLKREEFVALAEMMNFNGVINKNWEVMAKLKSAKKHFKPIDGHCPELSGEDLKKYIYFDGFDEKHLEDDSDLSKPNLKSSYISTEHESSSFKEAIEKKALNMKIMVRDGSSAKNMQAILNFNERLEFLKTQDFFGHISSEDFQKILKNPIFDFIVSDDKEPTDLIKGHLNLSLKKAIDLGIDTIEAIKMVSLNPSNHYNLNSGEIALGKIANFIEVDSLENLNVLKTYVHGELVAKNGKSLYNGKRPQIINNFNVSRRLSKDFDIYIGDKNLKTVNVNVIGLNEGKLITDKLNCNLNLENNIIQPNLNEDVLKISVINRYLDNEKNNLSSIGNGFVKGFNLKNGAIATSVSHDSHNLIVVGVNSNLMAKAANLVIENKGAIVAVSENEEIILPLPIAGLMSDKKIDEVADKLNSLNLFVKSCGSKFEYPFMNLSFLALLVIPHLKINSSGLFDADNFQFIDLIN
ncbi:adenine deaminase [Methanobrevibacter curvatus]|uniref:Adenine deaminase n=1 Tax=Methanobrevibacter curvatus TaxID=49547 RepID=A0A162FCQ2_9EURY|nr:adenine deaminase [Methanobrevibacter curvatus]KZX11085.1 adenine deaminase [Methanobrevibacter curvatus]